MGVAELQRANPRELTVHATAPTVASTSLWLVGEHFAAATVYLLVGAAGLVWIAPDLANGIYLTPHVAAVTHLFTLGWLTLTIFGALYQFMPVALGVPIHSARAAHAAFWMLAPGIGGFAYGLAESSTPFVMSGVVLVAIGILLAAGNVAATLARSRSRDVTWAAIATAIVFLLSVLALGAMLADNLHSGLIAADRVRVLAAHLHVAIIGWVLIVIVGVSHRMLPMFLLADGSDSRWSRRALLLLALGVPTLAVGLIGRLPAASWTGAFLVDAGVAAFVWRVYALYRVRVRRGLDPGMRFVRASLPFVASSAIMGPVLLGLGSTHTRLATAYVTTGLLGGLVLFVTGILYKIIPLLTWTVRFGRRLGRGPLPTAADLYSTGVARVQLTLTVAGVGLLLAGIAAASPLVARTGTLSFLGAIVLFVYQIGRIRWGVPAALRSPPPSL